MKIHFTFGDPLLSYLYPSLGCVLVVFFSEKLEVKISLTTSVPHCKESLPKYPDRSADTMTVVHDLESVGFTAG